MSSTLSNSELPSTEENAFVPMTEAQMSSIRGGTTWPEWFVDMVEDIVDSVNDALDYLDSTLMDPPPVDFDSTYWDNVEGTLEDEGFVMPGGPGM